jgi:hypothetical protein
MKQGSGGRRELTKARMRAGKEQGGREGRTRPDMHRRCDVGEANKRKKEIKKEKKDDKARKERRKEGTREGNIGSNE